MALGNGQHGGWPGSWDMGDGRIAKAHEVSQLIEIGVDGALLHHKPLNLLVSQCDHGVHFRGAASWNITRYQSHGDQRK
jgi:hypothetical protein